MPNHRLRIQQLTLILRPTLHTPIVSARSNPDPNDTLCSGVS